MRVARQGEAEKEGVGLIREVKQATRHCWIGRCFSFDLCLASPTMSCLSGKTYGPPEMHMAQFGLKESYGWRKTS